MPPSPPNSPVKEALSVDVEEEGQEFELPDLDIALGPNCDVSYYIRKKYIAL